MKLVCLFSLLNILFCIGEECYVKRLRTFVYEGSNCEQNEKCCYNYKIMKNKRFNGTCVEEFGKCKEKYLSISAPNLTKEEILKEDFSALWDKNAAFRLERDTHLELKNYRETKYGPIQGGKFLGSYIVNGYGQKVREIHK
jgi:hypothetical protein